MVAAAAAGVCGAGGGGGGGVPGPRMALLTVRGALPCREEARRQLQSFPRSATMSAEEVAGAAVVASGSLLPVRGGGAAAAAGGGGRSVVSGAALQGAPFVWLDDGQSAVTFSEGVMLSHAMRLGPMGTGKPISLLL